MLAVQMNGEVLPDRFPCRLYGRLKQSVLDFWREIAPAPRDRLSENPIHGLSRFRVKPPALRIFTGGFQGC